MRTKGMSGASTHVHNRKQTDSWSSVPRHFQSVEKKGIKWAAIFIPNNCDEPQAISQFTVETRPLSPGAPPTTIKRPFPQTTVLSDVVLVESRVKLRSRSSVSVGVSGVTNIVLLSIDSALSSRGGGWAWRGVLQRVAPPPLSCVPFSPTKRHKHKRVTQTQKITLTLLS